MFIVPLFFVLASADATTKLAATAAPAAPAKPEPTSSPSTPSVQFGDAARSIFESLI